MKTKMKLIGTIIIVFSVLFLSLSFNSKTIATKKDLSSNKQDILFVENMGQFDNNIRFLSYGINNRFLLTANALWVTLFAPEASSSQNLSLPQDVDTKVSKNTSEIAKRKGANIKIDFTGSNSSPSIERVGRSDTHFSYFSGNSSNWHADVPVWKEIVYKDLYPGIDLKISGSNQNIYPVLVARQASALNNVRMRIEGSENISIINKKIHISANSSSIDIPLLLLENNRNTTQSISNPMIIGNEIINPFKSSTDDEVNIVQQTPLSLRYSTFLGADDGADSEYGYGIAVGSDGSAYVTGSTPTAAFPTTVGAFDQTWNQYYDSFVLKLNPDGSNVEYATFVGGEYQDYANDIAVDSLNNAYIVGQTVSSTFPTTTNASDPSCGANGFCDDDGTYVYWDFFVTKLNASGTQLEYSTYYGNIHSDIANGVAVDGLGNAYVVGLRGWDPILQGSSQDDDAYVVKFSPTSAIVYQSDMANQTFFSSGSDVGVDITIDSDNAVYIGGYTNSSDFPITPNAYKSQYQGGDRDGFIAKLTTSGDILYSTYIGGSSEDNVLGVAIDSSKSIYATGVTLSSNFHKSSGAFQSSLKGTQDAFVIKLNVSNSSTSLGYSTFLGGEKNEQGNSIAVDNNKIAYIGGWTSSSTFPVSNDALDPTCGSDGTCDIDNTLVYYDGFVVKMSANGQSLNYGTFFGGKAGDVIDSLSLDSKNDIYVTGYTVSHNDFPVSPGGYDVISTNGTNTSIFAAKIGETPPPPPPDTPTNTPTDTPTSTPTDTPTSTSTTVTPVTESKNFLPSVLKDLPTFTPTPTNIPTITPTPTQVPCGDIENNDKYADAKPLAVFGQQCYGYIDDPVRGFDFYAISLSNGQTIGLELSDFPSNVNLDLYLYRKGDNTPVAFRSGGEPGQPERFSYTSDTDAQYYIGVFIRSIDGTVGPETTYYLRATIQ